MSAALGYEALVDACDVLSAHPPTLSWVFRR